MLKDVMVARVINWLLAVKGFENYSHLFYKVSVSPMAINQNAKNNLSLRADK